MWTTATLPETTHPLPPKGAAKHTDDKPCAPYFGTSQMCVTAQFICPSFGKMLVECRRETVFRIPIQMTACLSRFLDAARKNTHRWCQSVFAGFCLPENRA